MDYNEASKILHKEIKQLFNISSMSDVNVSDFEKYAEMLRMYFAREKGFIIRDPSEKDIDPNQLTMREFLNTKHLV